MQKGSGQSRATKHELLDILEICGQHDFMQHVILDGIDECKDSMGLILDLSSVFDNSKVKVIMFSRPHIRFPPEFICKGRIAIAKSNTDDIEAYLTRRLKELLGQGLFPSEAKLEMLLNPLITGADGMFLWAHLMMNYLASTALTRKQRLQEVRNITLPEGLDEMYDRIIEHISQRSRSEQSLASWIFMWLLFSRRQLKIAELETTLKVRGNSSDVDDFAEVDYADLGATIISTCGSLVERVSARNDDSSNLVDCYRFIHLSASEHFRSRLHRRRWRFLLSASDSHITLAKCCLRYIAHIGPEVKLRRSQMDTLGKEPGALRAAYYTKEYAFLPYAMRYWASHLKHHHDNILDVAKAMMYAESRDTLSSLWSILQAPHFNESDESRVQSIQVLTDLFSSIFEIVSNKEMFTTYIEMSYLLDTAGCFDYHSLDRWLTWATPRGQISAEGDEHIRQVIDDAKEMTRYLPFLHHEWGDTLSETPELIRDEVTAFTSCRLLHPVDSTTVYSFMADRADESSASKYLCRVSETSKDQSHLGIVSIWPSKCVYSTFYSFCPILMILIESMKT